MLFPQSAPHPWYKLTFNKPLLETEFQRAVFYRQSRLFQLAVGFLACFSTLWLIYTACKMSMLESTDWSTFATLYFLPFVAAIIETISILLIAIYFKRTNRPRSISQSICSCCIWLVILLSITMVLYPAVGGAVSGLSPVGIFSIYAVIVALAYSLLSLPLAAALIFSLGLTLLLEIALCSRWAFDEPRYVVCRFLIYIAFHAILVLYHVVYQSRLRECFWYSAQTLLTRRTIEIEQELKCDTVFSILPPIFANKFLQPPQDASSSTKGNNKTLRKNSSSQQVFRPLHVERFDNVSILFADICGFTKMASNKHAADLVKLLDELFSSFDKVCEVTGCEKITTLGDCYYCVSGCPTPRPDHAHCCVETGLGICRAIVTFATKHNEQVNMRVGVHTGNVLCGVVGLKRHKFDVWSNDVVLANEMESTGQAGRVHISEDTYDLVKDDYETEDGPIIDDNRGLHELEEVYDHDENRVISRGRDTVTSLRTYFIVRRKKPCLNQKLTDDDQIPGEQVTRELEFARTSRTADDAASLPLLISDQQVIVTRRNRTITVTTYSDEQPSTFAMVEELPVEPVERGSDDELQDALRQVDNEQNIFSKPPVRFLWLRFADQELEDLYRESPNDLRPSEAGEDKNDYTNFFARAKRNYFIANWTTSLILCAVVVAVCAVVNWLSAVAIVISIVFFVVAFVPTFVLGRVRVKVWPAGLVFATSCILSGLSGVVVLLNFNCSTLEQRDTATIYLIVVILSILHFAFYTNVPFYIRSTFGTALALIVVVLLPLHPCRSDEHMDHHEEQVIDNDVTSTTQGLSQSLLAKYYPNTAFSKIVHSPGFLWLISTKPVPLYCSPGRLYFEALIAIISVAVLLWLLAREYELVGRLAWYTSNRNKNATQAMLEAKKVTDVLIEDIFPKRILQHFDYRRQHRLSPQMLQLSKEHTNCGVMFACIKNFSDWYEEGYNSGEGCLRVLNEIFGDFESILDDPKYKSIEKIKTIGPCLMLASGLDREESSNNNNIDDTSHLHALIEYGLALIEALNNFNEHSMMRSFMFKIYIGFHAGDLISGVIGSTKIHYDIWGDTVNVASRMYSTGLPGRIQVTEEVAAGLLSDKFRYEKRGTIAVKGKDNMNTCLITEMI